MTDGELAVAYPLAAARLCVQALTWAVRGQTDPTEYGAMRMRHTLPALHRVLQVDTAIGGSTLTRSVPPASRPTEWIVRLVMAHIEILNVSKRFGATAALSDVSMSVEAGQVHGLLGENGAGKSTLMKVLSGVVRPDAGEVKIGGNQLRLGSPRDSREIGLAMAYQELSAPPNITVATKLCLPKLPTRFGFAVSQRELTERARARLREWEADHLDPHAVISELSLAARQEVEIVAALASSPKLLVLDEPTAALSDPNWLLPPAGASHRKRRLGHLHQPQARARSTRSVTPARCCATVKPLPASPGANCPRTNWSS